jgi:uncharacterized RDD family membrane protein YckC
MDTVQCASCGEEIGDASVSCPRCGADTSSGRLGHRMPAAASSEPAGGSPKPPAPPARPMPPASPVPQIASALYVPHHTVRRGIASVIGWVLVSLVALAAWGSAVDTSAANISVGKFLTLPTIVFGMLLVYGSVLESVRGATLGKLLIGVRARMLGGGRCSVGPAVLRNVSKAIAGAATALFPFGVAGVVHWLQTRGTFGAWTPIWSRVVPLLLVAPVCLLVTLCLMLTSPLRRRLGDRLASTVVVRRRAAYPGPAPAETPMPVSPYAG